MADAFWEFFREQSKILDEYKAIFPEKFGKKDCINTLWKARKNSNDDDKKLEQMRKKNYNQALQIANERARLAEEKVENLENEKKEFIKLINELCVKLNNNGGKK
jgi:hypothetical protein